MHMNLVQEKFLHERNTEDCKDGAELVEPSDRSMIDRLPISRYHIVASNRRYMVARMTEFSTNRTLRAGLFACLSVLMYVWQEVEARDLFPPKEQTTTEADPTQSPSFDDQKKGIPQSLFTWIKMAKGYEIEWDTFGRKGWYTQDPRLKPIEPGSVFTRDTPMIYIVFESAPLEDPAQFSAQWFLEGEKGILSSVPLGKDTLEVPGHERYGFLELKKPERSWDVGRYLVKLFITPLGQQPFHAANQVGTMR